MHLPHPEERADPGPNLYVVVVGAGEKRVGLVVDSLIGEDDVVIKPLNERFAASPGVAGATILGDGTVALMLDVGELLKLVARIHGTADERVFVTRSSRD